MTCQNACPNPVEFTLHALGRKPVNVCGAHIFAYTENKRDYIIQPQTLKGHIEAYKRSKHD